MNVSPKHLRTAIANIARWGDTDVLPFTLEHHWFHDAPRDVRAILEDIDANFDERIKSYPVQYDRVLTAVGHTGFRVVTQIDPIWNAYFLALVLSLAEDIERKRIPVSDAIVHSYRYHPDSTASTLFDKRFGWKSFQLHSLELAKRHDVVVSTDISDFYTRVYRHRIENALNDCTNKTEIVRRIVELLGTLSPGHVSYGLPVGGNASRILAELVLDRTDRLLHEENIVFTRFVDDYHLFAESKEMARRALVRMSGLLQRHEGLSLHRLKTKIMTADEFARTSPFAHTHAADSDGEAEIASFLKVRLRYDPYSPTAEDDYEQLRDELQRFDVVGMLARELQKTRVDEILVRQLCKSIKHLAPVLRRDAALTLCGNLEALYPVFPTVALVLKDVITTIDSSDREPVYAALRGLVEGRSHIVEVPTNALYCLRVLADDPSPETDRIFVRFLRASESGVAMKRDVILCLARRASKGRLADLIKAFPLPDNWQLRSLIVGSYVLGDEGKHWRQNSKRWFSSVDEAFVKWVSTKYSGSTWEIPL